MCAARTGIGDDVLAGLPQLAVGGLGDSEARALLLDNVYGPLDAAVCSQIVTESHGNPLALLELPRTWNAAKLAGGFGLPDSQPLGSRIEQSYAQRLHELPSDTQLLVLAAAAEPLGDSVLLHRAAEALGLEPAAADPAVAAGLITVGARVEFAHPLVRSAAYRSAAPNDRRRCISLSPKPRTPSRIRTAAPGIAHGRPRGPTRKSPPSSSGRPAAPRRAAAWPQPRRSSSGRPG